VSSGLYLGWRSAEDFTPSVRLQSLSFWLTLVFILESTLFILIGVQFPGAAEAIDEPAGTLIAASALVVAAVLFGRVVYVMAVGEQLTRIGRTDLTRRERLVVAWSGMRGAVSLAAALAVPLATDGGGAFPARDLIIFLALVTIAATLLIQGLTLPWLVGWARIEEPVSDDRAKALARFRTVEAALMRVTDMALETRTSQDLVERARDMYTERARQLSGICRAGAPDRETDLAEWTQLRRDLLRIEREELIRLRNSGEVPAPVMREVQHDLDLEEERLNRVVPAPGEARATAPEASRR
jgi:CPA1 family monovalent cation:H+ antiporter